MCVCSCTFVRKKYKQNESQIYGNKIQHMKSNNNKINTDQITPSGFGAGKLNHP